MVWSNSRLPQLANLADEEITNDAEDEILSSINNGIRELSIEGLDKVINSAQSKKKELIRLAAEAKAVEASEEKGRLIKEKAALQEELDSLKQAHLLAVRAAAAAAAAPAPTSLAAARLPDLADTGEGDGWPGDEGGGGGGGEGVLVQAATNTSAEMAQGEAGARPGDSAPWSSIEAAFRSPRIVLPADSFASIFSLSSHPPSTVAAPPQSPLFRSGLGAAVGGSNLFSLEVRAGVLACWLAGCATDAVSLTAERRGIAGCHALDSRKVGCAACTSTRSQHSGTLATTRN